MTTPAQKAVYESKSFVKVVGVWGAASLVAAYFAGPDFALKLFAGAMVGVWLLNMIALAFVAGKRL
jgi:hypothetical protein